jgi:hypothetical protein
MSQEIKKEQDTLANARVEYYKLKLIKAENNVKKLFKKEKIMFTCCHVANNSCRPLHQNSEKMAPDKKKYQDLPINEKIIKIETAYTELDSNQTNYTILKGLINELCTENDYSFLIDVYENAITTPQHNDAIQMQSNRYLLQKILGCLYDHQKVFFLSTLVESDGLSIQCVPSEYTSQRDIIKSGTKRNAYTFLFASDELKKNTQFVQELLKENKEIFKYLDEDMKETPEIKTLMEELNNSQEENNSDRDLKEF